MATILDPTGDPLLDPDGDPITDGAGVGIDAGHLVVHGGMLTVPVPPTITAGHVQVHGGVLQVGSAAPPAAIYSGGAGRFPIG